MWKTAQQLKANYTSNILDLKAFSHPYLFPGYVIQSITLYLARINQICSSWVLFGKKNVVSPLSDRCQVLLLGNSEINKYTYLFVGRARVTFFEYTVWDLWEFPLSKFIQTGKELMVSGLQRKRISVCIIQLCFEKVVQDLASGSGFNEACYTEVICP